MSSDGREILTARLRAMADWIDANPRLPLSPYSKIMISCFGSDMKQARAARRDIPGGWAKDTSPSSNYITYVHGRDDDDPDPSRWQVTYNLHVSKSATCERVQVGTRHIEEHDEPVFEWKCDA